MTKLTESEVLMGRPNIGDSVTVQKLASMLGCSHTKAIEILVNRNNTALIQSINDGDEHQATKMLGITVLD